MGRPAPTFLAALYEWDIVTRKGKRQYWKPAEASMVPKSLMDQARWLTRDPSSANVVLFFIEDPDHIGVPPEVTILWDSDYDRF